MVPRKVRFYIYNIFFERKEFFMNLYEDLMYRGLIKDFSDPELKDKLNNEKLTFYIGTDPTADSIFNTSRVFPFKDISSFLYIFFTVFLI